MAGAAFSPTASAQSVVDPLAYGFQGEGGLFEQDLDARTGALAPTEAQRAAVRALGARAEWNALGSPKVLTRDDAGYRSGPQAGEPEDVARAWVRTHAALFGLTALQTGVTALELLNAVPLNEGPELRAKMRGGSYVRAGKPFVVTFRQIYAGAVTGQDGLLTVGLDPEGRVAFVSSSVTGDTRVTNRRELSATAAYLAAAKEVGVEVSADDLTTAGLAPNGAQLLGLAGVQDQQRVRLVTVPTAGEGVRLAYETIVIKSAPGGKGYGHDGNPFAWTSLVDAQTGDVLVRTNNLDHLMGQEPEGESLPYFQVFPNAPDFPKPGVQTPDNRQSWCYLPGTDCDRVLGEKGGKPNSAGAQAYDETVTDQGVAVPTFSTFGNNARTAPSRVSFLTPDAAVAPVSPTRTYDFPFTDQWHSSGCDPTSFVRPGLNDVDAATTNLFTMHNRMHDWGYYLGFTEETFNAQVQNVGSQADTEQRENDPELGNSQAGSIGGGPTFQGRDNANQITLNDGIAPITNQYLWEPLQAGFYAPCTDGAYDQGIIGHEYGHMISNRMTAGPDNNLSGMQAGSMGESWSDLMAVEYLIGYGFAPYANENPFYLAPYVTGDLEAGIRNYGPNLSPLNYSDLEYDGNGTTSPHADGEIWNATQYDVRQALNAKYDTRFPSSNKALQAACADGLKASTACPGNRRWIQTIFDGYLLQPSRTTMLDSRDAILASDKMRYRGENLPTMWAAYAKRGMGVDASSVDVADLSSKPGFKNPTRRDNGSVRFKPVVAGGGTATTVKVFVGDYEARIMPVAVSEGGAVTQARAFEPGTYRLYVQSPGFGHRRVTVTVKPGAQTISLPLRRNLASQALGAQASGDGGNLALINDETETTNWGSIEGAPRNPAEAQTVRGKQVTVDLAGGASTVREVQVSAANRPALCTGDTAALGCEASREAPYDTGGQSRFAALRSFEILTCDATAGKDCASDSGFTSVRVARDAFPGGTPRPKAPDLTLRSFAVTPSKATHVRIKVLDNQCTGGQQYTAAANVEGNPLNDPDCTSGFTTAALAGAPTTLLSLSQKKNVRISELQVFGTAAAAAPARGAAPVVAPVAGPATGPGTVGRTLPTTGPLPIAVPALLLAGLGILLVRGRRRV